MTYFHRRTSTIIGAKAFHGPVRDGKAWGHLAMVVKRKGVLTCAFLRCRQANWGRSTSRIRALAFAVALYECAGGGLKPVSRNCVVCVVGCGFAFVSERHLHAITRKVIGSSRTGN